MNIEQMRLRIIGDNEQDRAMAEQWWKESSIEDTMRVWNQIQRKYPDPVMEIMSRFAQIAFGEMFEKLGLPGTDRVKGEGRGR